MRYGFIREQSDRYPTSLLCKLMQVSTSGYYAYLASKPSARDNSDILLGKKITDIHQRTYGCYGKRRLQAALKQEGGHHGLQRIAKVMKAHNIVAKVTKRFKITTQSKHSRPIAPNVLVRNFAANKPNQSWVSDISYLRLKSGFVYLAVVMDLYSRKVIGWSVDKRMEAELVCCALDMAKQRRGRVHGCILHSDQGIQYTALPYQIRLKKYGLIQSMSRKGNCWDNAPCESLFHSMKTEWLDKVYENVEEARTDVFHFIERFYNRYRLHSTIGYQSPDDYERAALAA